MGGGQQTDDVGAIGSSRICFCGGEKIENKFRSRGDAESGVHIYNKEFEGYFCVDLNNNKYFSKSRDILVSRSPGNNSVKI